MKIAPEILTAAREGDAAAFNEIVLNYRGRVIGTIARLINQPEDAEDVAQEVFTRVYFGIQKLREQAAFETWLQRLTLNAAYDYLRGPCRRRRRETRMGDVSESAVALADSLAARRVHADDLNRIRTRELVEELLSTVSEADRVLLVLREVDGLSMTQLESIYETNQNALKVRLFRARQRVLKACRTRQDARPLDLLAVIR
jgi:RNA polymerase sigma-70 factor (ECF subfamily)